EPDASGVVHWQVPGFISPICEAGPAVSTGAGVKPRRLNRQLIIVTVVQARALPSLVTASVMMIFAVPGHRRPLMQMEFPAKASWLDEARVTGYARIFVCLFAVASIIWIVLSPQLIDPNGKPIGTDFMTVWSAGKLALTDEPASAYDYERHHEIQRQALPW